MTTLYLIRHGESEANFARVFTGSSNFPLTDKGMWQAKMAAEYLKDKKIDLVYASPLNRAYNTGKAVSDLLNIPIIPVDGLKEINAGVWEGRKFDDLETEYPDTYHTWRNDIGNARPDGGESVAELYDRVVKTISEIAKQNNGKNIAIASHATPIRAFGGYCFGIKKENLRELPWPANAAITKVEFDGEKFINIEYGFEGHLGDAVTKLPKNV